MKSACIAAGLLLGGLLSGCPERPLDRARRLEAAGQSKEAAQAYQQVAKADPANLAAWDKAVELLCAQGTAVNDCMGILDLERELLENQSSSGARARQRLWARTDPDLVSLREDPRFAHLVGADDPSADR